MKHLATLTVCVALLAGSPARAQQVEIVPLAAAGFTMAADIDRNAPEISELRIKDGFTWGGQVGYFLSQHWGIEGSFTRQATAMEIGTSAGRADLFEMNVGKLHGNVVYQFAPGGARVRPFLFAGLGTTFFSARYLKTETKLSTAIGGGIKYFPRSNVGVSMHLRYAPTRLDDESAADFCDPFGFCQGTLQQIDLMTGLILRF
jgi:opacity protein-like surface antigen